MRGTGVRIVVAPARTGRPAPRATPADPDPAARARRRPVDLELDPPGRVRRRDAVGPLLVAPLLGVVGPLALWPALLAHVALPVTVARHVRDAQGRARFADDDVPRIAEGIEWLVALCGWSSLMGVPPPWSRGRRGLRLRIRPPAPPPTPGRALLRLASGLPAMLGQLLIAAAALVPWAALVACVLVAGRRPALLWRLQARVLARQAAVLCQAGSVGEPPAADGLRRGPVDDRMGR